uniref:CAP-Gly domain-containing protein n=2 Tax=Hyaloperonospora arabidopsidis (strain Emoy2) TaxID=559515 RepID=M4C0L7_HYAAE
MELEVGARVTFGANKTGIVRFIGETDFASGQWVGIELERPEGKNNGELNGRVYFTCAPNHGLFVKHSMVRSIVSPSPVIGSHTSQTRQPLANSSSRVSEPKPRTSLIAPSTRSNVSLMAAAARSRLSLDRRTSDSSRMSGSGAKTEDQVTAAAVRIAQLEEALEQKNRQLEQLRQSVTVMKEAAAAAGAGDMSDQLMTEQQGQEMQMAGEPKKQVDAEGDEMMEEIDDAGPKDDVKLTLPATAALQEEQVHEIEHIREEAEKHVRVVRAELADHIDQLQKQQEMQLEELRRENTTQASLVSALEAEVAQQKARIAAFTVAEQKKAEEVAMAVAKSSSGARKVEALTKQVVELQDMIEMMTLERETVEMDKAIAEEHAEELQQEVEKLKAAMALSATTGHDYSEQCAAGAGELADENQKLRAAVKMLHERGSEEKAELSKKLRQVQRENAELVSLREEVEELTTKKNKLENEAEELKEMLDVANAYESMVEDLTEKNLTLGEKLAELETTVQSLESLREVDQEMEHQHTEYEAELRDEIDSQRAALQELKQAALNQKVVFEDKERTIARFRDLAHGHREEIAQLKAKLRDESGTVESLKDTAHLALNQTMGLRTLVATAREHEIEAAKQKIISDQARLEISFLRAVVPNSIFSEADQKVLRVRLTLGRIAGKVDILLHHLNKELDTAAHQQTSSDQQEGEKNESVSGAVVCVEHLILGDRLAAVSCQAKEDLFMLECHLTTDDEFAEGCSALDTSQTAALESVLDSALSAFSEGAFLNGSRSGSDAASLYDRLFQTSEEWHNSRVVQVSSATGAESFGARCAVVKLRARKSVAKLAFSISSMVTFLRTTKSVLASSEPSNEEQASMLRTELMPVLEKCLGELLSLLNVAQLFYHRAEIDLAASDDDLDGLVAAGGEVVTSIHKYGVEAQSLLAALQSHLDQDGSPVHGKSAEELVQFMQQGVYDHVVAFKEKLAMLYKLVCRGAFTDAVAPRSRNEPAYSANGRPQWRIRAQAIHQELVDASALRSNLAEMTELCNTLHQRIREFERADSQHRVVAQKLESQVLQLTDGMAAAISEKTHLESQLSKEREQFVVALDESNKEKTLLSSLNRDLRKQLKRTSIAKDGSGGNVVTKESVPSAIDAEAFQRAFHQLHTELHRVRSTLAKERLERLLGSSAGLNTRPSSVSTKSDRLAQSLTEVAAFSRQVKAQLSMPRLVDLKQTASSSGSSARAQLTAEKLQQSRLQRDLTALRERVGAAVRDDGWGDEVTNAITRGERVFGWQTPKVARPPVFMGRVKLGSSSATDSQAVQLVLNRSEVKYLSDALMC